ncbi:hypothetical protein EC973_003674 [Apophysomyces ossiformis]|uniref:Up-regulated during septation protein 1 domain-containing protein n=1 Tax=Apophysomyces ossiformis TaxID=679940 RepID=A0A8H7EL05_9FUNG|nr:hypothetical protein EC973_003674 [Apophysomyces ossiformis]
MIPLARQSTDDDRPIGLKLARNMYGFQRDNGSNTQGSSHLSKDMFRRTLPRDETPRESVDSDYSSRPSFSGPAKGLFQQGTATPSTSTTSPVVPARSPFRIRDSQASLRANMEKTKRGSTPQGPSSQHPHHDTPSRLNELTSDIHQRPISINRESLSVELARLWKSKPDLVKPEDSKSTKAHKKMMDQVDDILLQLLISQAMIEARRFQVLSFEQLEDLQQQHSILLERVVNLTSRLAVEIRIKDTARSLAHLDPSNSKENALEADRKVDHLYTGLSELTEQESNLRRKILEHTAGVLAIGIQKLETEGNQKIRDSDKDAGFRDLEKKLMERETEIQSLRADSFHSDQNSRQMADLRSELEQMTNRLDMIVRRYQLEEEDAIDNLSDSAYRRSIASSTSSLSLLDSVEKHLTSYKTKVQQLERKLEARDREQEFESLSEKKLELQLQAMQTKKEAAEARCEELIQQSKQASQNSSTELELRLTEAEQRAVRAEEELQKAEEEKSRLKLLLAEMELKSNKAQSQATHMSGREKELQEELDKYREEALSLNAEKEKWQRILKRQSLMEIIEGDGDTLKTKYEQQLEELSQEYDAQLNEQRALLEKTNKTCEQLRTDRDKSAAICKDLEDLIRDKSRILDARDLQITKLEAELQELRHGSRPNADLALREAQKTFAAREAAWIEQNAAVEANFEGMLKEFDRLTSAAMDFETSRMKYERRIDELSQEIHKLDTALTNERINKLGYGTGDTPTTASLRKEFRSLVNDMKAEHQRQLDREAEENKRLERLLKDMKHDREMLRYERVNKSVQTAPVAWQV